MTSLDARALDIDAAGLAHLRSVLADDRRALTDEVPSLSSRFGLAPAPAPAPTVRRREASAPVRLARRRPMLTEAV